MRLKRVELYKVKSFSSKLEVDFDESTSVFSFSGMNGSGKSTILKSAWIAQKAYFCKMLDDAEEQQILMRDVSRLLNSKDSYIKITMKEGGRQSEVKISWSGADLSVSIKDEESLLEQFWDPRSPKDIILFIDASKGFSESTLSFNEIDIAENSKSNIALEAVLRPESIFTGVYRQLVRDWAHDRLVPNKPDRLIYHKLASEMFSFLMPNVEIANFSGTHSPGEFVLLGKAHGGKRKPRYDVREFSSGEKALLSTLTFLCISKSVSALIIDEPENHFHESLLLEFIGFLYDLSENGGVLNWVESVQKNGHDISIKGDWLEAEYRDFRINQVIVSTHSKSLIYKVFSLGKNFSVSDEVRPLDYGGAESELRSLGISSIYNKIIFVEGTGDQAALEYVVKDKNVSVKSLGGSSDVIETFKRLASVKNLVSESEFIFLVDSDNKEEEYFERLRSVDGSFYDSTFIKLSKHEFENYLLDATIFRDVVNDYLRMSGESDKEIESNEVKDNIIAFAQESLPQVFKKELALSFQREVESHFSGLLWGDKKVGWGDKGSVDQQISGIALSQDSISRLEENLKERCLDVFGRYEKASNDVLIDRCDGKQVFGKMVGFYADYCGIKSDKLKKSIYRYAFSSPDSIVSELVHSILEGFSKTDAPNNFVQSS